jgi:CheY-like chemotaxis protein
MVLKYEPSFPTTVLGDLQKFQFLFTSIMSHIIANIRETQLEVKCLMKRLTPEGHFVVGFQILFPPSKTFTHTLIKEAMEHKFENPDIDINRSFVDDEFGLFMSIVTPILLNLKGSPAVVNFVEKSGKIEITFEIPFPNSTNPPRIPKLLAAQNFNLTFTRIGSQFSYTWKDKPVDESNKPTLSNATGLQSITQLDKDYGTPADRDKNSSTGSAFNTIVSESKNSAGSLSGTLNNQAINTVQGVTPQQQQSRRSNFGIVASNNVKKEEPPKQSFQEFQSQKRVQGNQKDENKIRGELAKLAALGIPQPPENNIEGKGPPPVLMMFEKSEETAAPPAPSKGKAMNSSQMTKANNSGGSHLHEISTMIRKPSAASRPTATSIFDKPKDKEVAQPRTCPGTPMPMRTIDRKTSDPKKSMISASCDVSPWGVDNNYQASKPYKFQEYNLKLAVSSALSEILSVYDKTKPKKLGDTGLPSSQAASREGSDNEQDKKSVDGAISCRSEEGNSERNEESPFKGTPQNQVRETPPETKKALKGMKGKITSNVLLDKVVANLTKRLPGPNDEKSFIKFLRAYNKKIEKHLQRLDINGEGGFSGKEAVGLMSPADGDKIEEEKLLSNENDNIFERKVSGFSSDLSHESVRSGSNRLLDPTLRMPMSPQINKMIKSHVGLGEKARELQLNKSVFRPKEKEIIEKTETEKTDHWRSMILPFKSFNLPAGVQDRTRLQRRKWIDTGITSVKPVIEYKDTFTILAVDDSEFILEALDKLVVPQQKIIERGKTGMEAFQKYLSALEQGKLYHLILMDLQMPIMDGFEATSAIRDHEKKKNLPRSYICGLSANDCRNKCITAGMDNFYIKPMTATYLSELIDIRQNQIQRQSNQTK